MTPHLLRCQGIAVGDYNFTLGRLELGHPRLSLNQGLLKELFFVNFKRLVDHTGGNHGDILEEIDPKN